MLDLWWIRFIICGSTVQNHLHIVNFLSGTEFWVSFLINFNFTFHSLAFFSLSLLRKELTVTSNLSNENRWPYMEDAPEITSIASAPKVKYLISSLQLSQTSYIIPFYWFLPYALDYLWFLQIDNPLFFFHTKRYPINLNMFMCAQGFADPGSPHVHTCATACE